MMDKNWFPLQGVPANGKTFVLEDPAAWATPLQEFGVACRVLEPIRAEIFVLAQEQGVLFRGSISGKVALPCDRCANDSEVTIRHRFDSFEPYPADSPAPAGKDSARQKPGRTGRDDADESRMEDILAGDSDEAVIRQAAHGRGIEINPGALAWEEFSLALPVKPLCREACRGLCPVCGVNRNAESCSCAREEGDPRLAALQGLLVKK